MIPATITCALATLVLVLAEWRGWGRARALAKYAAAASFLVVGGLAWRGGTGGPAHAAYAGCILVGLAFGAIGDVALLGASSRAFLAGLGAFLVGHLAYVVAIAYVLAPARWVGGAGPLAVLPILVGLGTVALLWPRLGAMKLPVVAYLIAIVAMAIGAFAVWRTHALGAAEGTELAAGAALFFASDVSVARNRFVGDSITNKAWGLPAYFAGQLLIAWSAR